MTKFDNVNDDTYSCRIFWYEH